MPSKSWTLTSDKLVIEPNSGWSSRVISSIWLYMAFATAVLENSVYGHKFPPRSIVIFCALVFAWTGRLSSRRQAFYRTIGNSNLKELDYPHRKA